MSGFADALARSQNLAPLADSLNTISQQIQQNKARKNFFNAMDSYHSQINNLYNPQPQPNLNKYIPQIPAQTNINNSSLGTLLPNNNRTLGSLISKPGQPQQTNMQSAVQPNNQTPDQAPEQMTPEQSSAITTPGVDINSANRQAQDLEYNAMLQMIKDKVPSNLLNYGQGALQSLITQNQPLKPILKDFDKKKDLYSIDPTTGEPTLLNAGEPDRHYEGNKGWWETDSKTKEPKFVQNPDYHEPVTIPRKDKNGNIATYKIGNKEYYDMITTNAKGEVTKTEPKQVNSGTKISIGNDNKNIENSSNTISGIASLNNFKKVNRQYNVDELNRMGLKDGNGKPFTKPQTLMVNPKTNLLEPASQTEINAAKEKMKNGYRKSAIEETQRLGVYPAIKRIQQSIDKGMPHDKALQLFMKANPNLDENTLDAIKNYFELDSQ